MGIANLSYEACRQKRMEENKKRLEDLNLPLLASSLHSPKPSPMKKSTPKTHDTETRLVPLRRSARVASNPAPVYAEVKVGRIGMSGSTYGVPRGNSRYPCGLVYVSEEVRASAIDKAEKLVETLGTSFPTLVRPMLPSHVSGCFWLGLPVQFCRDNMPRNDEMVTLVDEEGEEYPTVWLQRKTGLSGGWKGFAQAHGLVDGDAVVFQVIKHGVLKVYIIRANGLDDEDES